MCCVCVCVCVCVCKIRVRRKMRGEAYLYVSYISNLHVHYSLNLDRSKRVFITNVKGTFLGMSESNLDVYYIGSDAVAG
jgi:hypothetical protein